MKPTSSLNRHLFTEQELADMEKQDRAHERLAAALALALVALYGFAAGVTAGLWWFG